MGGEVGWGREEGEEGGWGIRRGGGTMGWRDGRQFRHLATPKEAVSTRRLAVLECTHIR